MMFIGSLEGNNVLHDANCMRYYEQNMNIEFKVLTPKWRAVHRSDKFFNDTYEGHNPSIIIFHVT